MLWPCTFVRRCWTLAIRCVRREVITGMLLSCFIFAFQIFHFNKLFAAFSIEFNVLWPNVGATMCNSNQRYSYCQNFPEFLSKYYRCHPKFLLLPSLCVSAYLSWNTGFLVHITFNILKSRYFSQVPQFKGTLKFFSKYLFCALQWATSGHVVDWLLLIISCFFIMEFS